MNRPLFPSTSNPSFALPLSPSALARAISAGHGRAWQHASAHGLRDHHDTITHALLYNLAHHQLAEGDRAHWLIGLIDAAGDSDGLLAEAIERIHDPIDGDNTWRHVSQRCTLMGALAKRGIAPAREALYRLFIENLASHPDNIHGALDIISLDGDRGLAHVASTLGQDARTRGAASVVDWFLSVYDEDHAERFLQDASAHDAGIRHFLSVRDAQPRPPHDAQRAGFQSASEFLEWAGAAPHTPNTASRLRGWARRASDAALDEVISALDTATSPLALRRCLRVFSDRTPPRVSDRMLALAAHNDAAVRDDACRALRHISDPRVRDLALRSLNPTQLAAGSLQLLESSYQPGDHRAIERALAIPSDAEQLGAITESVASLCARVRLPECVPLLLFVYEHSPSGMWRHDAIRTLTALDAVPRWIAQESRFDSDADTRAMFGGPSLDD